MSVAECRDRERIGFTECYPNSLTGDWNDIYSAAIAGVDLSPDQLYVIECEAHGEHTSARSLALAKISAGDTTQWCRQCRALAEVKERA